MKRLLSTALAVAALSWAAPAHADIETYRFIADIGLKSNVSDRLALATTYTARYENKPLPTVTDLDSIASINLVYSFF